MKSVLTSENDVSDDFEIHGESYICIKGTGKARIERRIGSSFEVVTTDHGEPLVFAAQDGVLFNNSLRCNKAIKHRVVAETASEITVEVIKGGR